MGEATRHAHQVVEQYLLPRGQVEAQLAKFPYLQAFALLAKYVCHHISEVLPQGKV
jgi:hypothetical protein